MKFTKWALTLFLGIALAVLVWFGLVRGQARRTERGVSEGRGPRAVGQPPAVGTGGAEGHEQRGLSSGDAGSAPAEAEVAGPAWDAAKADQSGDVLWGIGRMDGRPADETAPLVAGEFARLKVEGAVVTIRDLGEFPQVIGGGQSLVIHLGELPQVHLVLRLGLASEFPSEDALHRRAGAAGRSLRILFNDQLVWHRVYNDGHALIEAYIPPAWVETRANNLLVLENTGVARAAFDFVRLERFSTGPEMLVAATGLDRHSGEVASAAARTVVELPSPAEWGANLAAAGLPGGEVQPPADFGAAIAAARALPPPEGLVEQEANWRERLIESLRRGLLPWVWVRGSASREDWRGVAQRYGGLIHGWILSDREALGAIRQALPEARIHISPSPLAEASPEYPRFTNWGTLRGPIEIWLGHERRTTWETTAERVLRPGLWIPTNKADLDAPSQRRWGHRLVMYLMEFWMAGGMDVVVEAEGHANSFFANVAGVPSPAWTAAKWLFGLGEGRPRRIGCHVVPLSREPLNRTTWVAVENGPELVTFLVLAGFGDEERRVRVSLPVPWEGKTEGALDGVDIPPWNVGDPRPMEPRRLQFDSTFDPTRRSRSAEGDGRGAITLELDLAGLRRIRLWPVGRPPQDRAAMIGRLPPARASSPPVQPLYRIVTTLPPRHHRMERLRCASPKCYGHGPTGGDHIGYYGPATRATLPLPALTQRFREQRVVEVRNVVPDEANSLFVYLSPGKPNYSYQMGWNGNVLGDVKTIWFWARVKLPDDPPPARGAPPPAPVTLWFGNLSTRGPVRMPLEQWVLLTAPRKEVTRARRERDSWYNFHVWLDDNETRAVEVELNGFYATYETAPNGRPLQPSRAAGRWEDNGGRLLLALEAPVFEPTAYRFGLEQPMKLKRARVIKPEGWPGVRVLHREEAQLVDIHVEDMPAAPDALLPEETERLFPGSGCEPDPGYSRILIEFEFER